jgi:hypothetical protein
MADREVEVVVQIGGEDVLAGRLWAHRRRTVESATFSYAPEYLTRDAQRSLGVPRLLDLATPRRVPVLMAQLSRLRQRSIDKQLGCGSPPAPSRLLAAF